MIGRVTEEHKTNYIVNIDDSEYRAVVRGKFHIGDEATPEFPKVGDYVSCSLISDNEVVIESVEPRQSVIVRKTNEGNDKQVLVANVSLIFIVVGLDGDFNMNRIERYLLLAEQSNIKAVVLLNKSDLVTDKESFKERVESRVGQVPVYLISTKDGQGMNVFSEYINQDTTAVLLGSSGAGKSSITNWLLDQNKQSVQSVREDDSRGRHTTTSRQLFTLPNGGFLIDTPGMRELGLVGDIDETNDSIFLTIEKLSHQCKFPNCDHMKSAGCRILEAIKQGEIESAQLDNYLKLKREQEFDDSKTDKLSTYKYKKKQKSLQQSYKTIRNKKYKERGSK